MRHQVPWSRIKSSTDSSWNLTQEEVRARRAQYGSNDITAIHKNLWLELVQNTLADPMIWFLILTSALFAWLGNYHEAWILGLAVIPLIAMDFFLHWRTQTSTHSLSRHLATDALVIRDDLEQLIPAAELVPGDLVVLRTGYYVPADGLFISGTHVQVDESSLSGESMPEQKSLVDAITPLIEQCHWLFAGTKILTGTGLMRVVSTGGETLYGQIIQSTLETSKTKTPLQHAIHQLVLSLIIMTVVFCAVLATVRYTQGFGVVDALLSAATLAVAALPDEFPVVFTFFLGVGVYRLAQNNALVRRAVSVENLGRVNVICSDKTGTMTEGQFKIVRLSPRAQLSEADLLQFFAQASRQDSYDLLDSCILTEAKNLPRFETHHTIPFNEQRKRETAIITHANGRLAVTKGAPETVLNLCNLSLESRQHWEAIIQEWASSGFKVIACATATMPEGSIEEPSSGYEWQGLLAFSDPLRIGVKEAIATCRASSIHVIMITGDHPVTAMAIAKELGLGQGEPRLVLGEDLDTLLTPEAGEQLLEIDVIARAVPARKIAVVQALQASGALVAVTGDGVNDVPAIKAADVGIAMGERGTQSAREVADIILLDDRFPSIVQAIEEGRQLFSNLKRCFKYLLLIHFPFVFSAALGRVLN